MLMAEKKPNGQWQLLHCHSLQMNWEQFDRNWAVEVGVETELDALDWPWWSQPDPSNTLGVGCVRLQEWHVAGWAALISLLYSVNEDQN